MVMSAPLGVGYVPFLTNTYVTLRFERPPPDPKPLQTVGHHVRERRMALGLSQALAALRIGVSRDALARWEINPVEPNVWLMPAIIDFLGYDPQPAAKNFPELLLRNRRALGLNQPRFAAALGVPASTLHAWERGLYEPTKVRRFLIELRVLALARP
jgi:DNA-binding transcriptional regulator YiaG